MSVLPEKDMILRCSKGDKGAQKQLYDQYARKLYAVSLRYAKNEQDAQDMIQESFIKIFHHISTYQFKGSFEGWMKKIVVNIALKYYQRFYYTKERTELDVVHQNHSAEPEILNHLSEAELLKLIAELPELMRYVFNLFVIEGYTHAEISAMLEIEETTSRSYLLRARKSLIVKIEKMQKVNP